MYTHEEMLERYYGPIGSPTRLAFEREMEKMEIRHQAALKAAQTRKRNREERERQKIK